MNDDPIQNARQDVRAAFWLLGITAAIAVCGRLLDISWLKAGEAAGYFWMGALGLALLARLIINCTDHIVTELSASKNTSLERSLSSIEQSVSSLESKLSSIEWSLSSIEATLKDLEGKWAGEASSARLKSIGNGLAEVDERINRQTKK